MNSLYFLRKLTALSIVTVLVLVAAFNVPVALASGHTFNLKVMHNINGKDLGLDKDLPVNVYINGAQAIGDFRFGEMVSTSLPAGTYTINVTLLDGTPLPSMDVGPVTIPGGVDVDIRALLDRDDTPILRVRTSESEPVSRNFKLIVKHEVNGRDLGLAKDLPVNVFVNGGLAIPGFEFGDKVTTALPGGVYDIAVTLADGTPVPSMAINDASIPAGALVIIKAKLNAIGVPVLQVAVK